MKLKRIGLMVISLVVAVSMLASTCVTPVFAVGGTEDSVGLKDRVVDLNNDGEINYVALGDSMTNGFGHPGYYLALQKHLAENHAENPHLCTDPSAKGNGLDGGSPEGGCPFFYGEYAEDTRYLDWSNNYGYLSNAPEAYPTKLAALLATETGMDVNQLNMAISGMRAEELRFMLDIDYYGDGYTGKFFRGDSSITGSSECRLFNARQNSVNPWNYNLDGSADHQYLRDLRAMFGATWDGDYCKHDPELFVDYSALGLGTGDQANLNAIALVRTEYKYALENAEIITIALGTNNFGTGVQSAMYRAIESAFGVVLGDTTDYKYDINDILADCPEMAEIYPEVYQFIYDTVMGMPEIVGMFETPADAEVAVKDIVETYAYGLIGFMVNYEESLKLIRELNPDAPIVAVGAMNMEEGIHFVIDGKDIDFGGLYGAIVDLGNIWLMDHIAEMDNVYYSETENLSLIVDEIAAGNWNSNMLSLMAADFAWNSGQSSNMAMRLRTIRALNTFGIHNEEVLAAVEAYRANPEDADAVTAVTAFAQKMVDRYDAFGALSTAGSFHVNIDLTEAITAVGEYYIAMQLLAAMEEAAKDPYINMDSVVTWFKDDGFKSIFTNVDLLDDDGIQDLLYFYSRMMFANGAGVHPSVKGHEDIAKDIFDALETGRTGAEALDNKLNGYKDSLLSMFQSMYPDLYAALLGASSMGELDDLAIIFAMLKMSDNEALNGVDLDLFEASIRMALRRFEESTTPEEQAVAQEHVYSLMRSLWKLVTAVTGVEYVADEDSYYVAFGDSNLGGLGLDGYKETNSDVNNLNGIGQKIEGSAPVLLAQKLFGEDWEAHYAPYMQGGIRAEDLLYILGGDVTPDQYYTERVETILYKGTLDATRADYIATLKKADLISFTIGGGNVSTFVGYQVGKVAAGQAPMEMDWSKIGFENAAVEDLKELLDTLVPIVDTAELLDKYVPAGLEINDPAKYVYVLLESILYGYASYNYYYPQVLDKIREINPDAQLLVLGMFNPVDEWALTLEIEGEEIFVNIGGIATNAMDAANLQSLAYALMSENTSYIDIRDTETFLDAENDAPTFEDYYKSVMNDNGKKSHASEDGHVYIYEQMYAALNGEDAVIDATLNTLLELRDLLLEYYDEVYAYAYDVAVEEGVIAQINGYLDLAINAVCEARDTVNEYIAANPGSASPEFKAEADLAFDQAVRTIMAAQNLIKEADELDADAYEALLTLLDNTLANLDDVATLLAVAAVDLGHYLDTIITELKEQTEAKIAELIAQAEKQLEILNEQLKTAVGEAREAILAEIARIEAELAAAIAAAKAALEQDIAEIKAALEAEIARLEAELAAAIEALKADIEALNNAAKAAIEEALGELIKEIQGIIENSGASMDSLMDALYGLLDMEAIGEDVEAMLNSIVEVINEYILQFISGELVYKEDLFYLAIVDGDEGYAAIVAEALNLSAEQYKVVTADEVTAEDIAKADLITVGYNGVSALDFALVQGIGYAGEYIDVNFRDDINAYLASAFKDILSEKGMVTMSTALNEALDGVVAEYFAGMEAAELDWKTLVGDKNYEHVLDAQDAFAELLIGAGVPEVFTYTIDVVDLLWTNADALGIRDLIDNFNQSYFYDQLGENANYTIKVPVCDVISFIADSAMYEFVSYNIEYSELMNSITATNPDAVVAALGNYNRFEIDYAVVIEEMAFTLEEVLADLGIDGSVISGEIKQVIDALSSVEYAIRLPVVELVNKLVGQYDEAVDNLLLSIELPINNEYVDAAIAELVKICNTGVYGLAVDIVEASTYTITLPVDDALALVAEYGYELDELINASLNTEITIGETTITANGALGAIANLTSIHPFAYAVMYPNVFYVDICDARIGGVEYIAIQILNALTVTCEHVYDDCEDAICNVCGEEREPIHHSFTNYVSNDDATCTEDGTKTATCDNGCGAEDTIADEGSKKPHSFTNYVSNNDATCDQDGTKTATCDYGCGAEDTIADEGSAKTHSFTNYVSNNDATCEADGTKTATCDHGCGAEDTIADEGSKKTHSFTNYVSNNDATCEQDGTKTATCDHGCGTKDTVADVGSAKGHDMKYVSNHDATCDQDGTKTGTCANGCGKTETVIDRGSAMGHNFKYVSNNDATCDQDGTKTGTCANGCGTTSTVVDEGSAKGHSFTNYVSNNDATCGKDGTKTAACDHGCGAKDTVADVGSAKTHSYTKYTSNNDATCSKDGTKTATCDNGCGAKETVTDTGSKKSHSFTNYVSNNDATCEQDGTKTATCDDGCGVTSTIADEGSAKGHQWKDATCTAPKTCEVCGKTEGEAASHTYGEWETVKEATKKEEGERKQTCTACGNVVTEAIPVVESGAPVGLIVGIVGGSVVLLGGLVLLLLFLKKRSAA